MRLTLQKLLRLISTCAMLCVTGCGTRTVLVPEGEPVRLAQPTKARVWVRSADGTWIRGSNTVTLPEGWYALSMPSEDKAKTINSLKIEGKTAVQPK